MKASLLRLIRCPDCAATLSLLNAREQNAEIVSGILQCQGCRSSFPIEDGLPVILRSDTLSARTRASFGKQWKLHEQRRFEQETIYGKSRQEGLHDFQRAFGLADLASLQDCMILDAGCGSGVLTADIGRAVPAATVLESTSANRRGSHSNDAASFPTFILFRLIYRGRRLRPAHSI